MGWWWKKLPMSNKLGHDCWTITQWCSSKSLVIALPINTAAMNEKLYNHQYVCIYQSTKWVFIIIIIISKRSAVQAGSKWSTHYLFKYPHPIIPTYRQWEDNEENRKQKEIGQFGLIKNTTLLVKPASPTPSNTGSARLFHRDTERGIKVLLYCKVLQWGGIHVSDARSEHCV